MRTARELDDADLPPLAARYDGPPPPRAWADRDPVAAARLTRARADLKELAESLGLPVENLLTPDFVRRVLWEPPGPDDPGTDLAAAVTDRLGQLGARRWQIELTRDVLVNAITTAAAEAAQAGDGQVEDEQAGDEQVGAEQADDDQP